MTTLHLTSHTHWDREWYLTFQQFRLKLVKLIDDLLDIFENDPNYRYYTLDGQTIILDDYLYMRPEREADLRRLITSGKLLIGPWHILPDEFLVSPEASVRNLLQGERTARRFGNKMNIGYIPDPFGHIGQMPQILRGFDIPYASVQRGLDAEPCEFWWAAPDGSTVLMAYLRDGYGNVCDAPMDDPQGFAAEIRRKSASLSPHARSGHLLLMHGVDHRPAHPATSALIDHTNTVLAQSGPQGDRLIHSSLPEYFAALQAFIEAEQPDLPGVCGELRQSHRHPLLPNVLSARMWIKQRNNTCETLLEKWAEPFSVLSERVLAHTWPTPLAGPQPKAGQFAPILRQAWRMLMECHPHDSICGCSTDAVHAEMGVRFDQVEQVGEEITRQSLLTLAAAVNTLPETASLEGASAALVVFNPHDIPTGGAVQAVVAAQQTFDLLDAAGRPLPYETLETSARNVTEIVVDRAGLSALIARAKAGDNLVQGKDPRRLTIQEVRLERCPESLYVEVYLSERPDPDPCAWERIEAALAGYLADPALNKFFVLPRTPSLTIRFNAGDVPAHGYRTYWLRPSAARPAPTQTSPARRIENEFFSLEANPDDGTLSLTDRRSGQIYPGLNRFVDGGDAGDEYNYSPPPRDRLLSPRVAAITVEDGPLGQALRLELALDAPDGLSADRQARAIETRPLTINTQARLLPGVARLEIHTRVQNAAPDHRLRVHFPAPFAAHYADYDGHYEIVRRPMALPPHDASWIEDPRPEVPQRRFTALHGPQASLAVAARGLPEVEVQTNPAGQAEIALTLLRCVGWLSRGDLLTRRCHAGPFLPTPEAQMIGAWEFDYAVIPGQPEQPLDLVHQAHAFSAALRASPTGLHAGPLAPAASLIQIEPPEFLFSALKEAEDGRGCVLRGYNLGGAALQAQVRLQPAPAQAARAALSETALADLPLEAGGCLRFPVGPYQIATLRLS